MALTIKERPQKDLFANNPPELYDISYYTSKWNALGGLLPVQYILESDLFPTNTLDPVDTICSIDPVASGFVRVSLDFVPSPEYEVKQFVTIAGNSTTFDGIHKIIQKLSSTLYVIDVAFEGSIETGGTMQLHRNNYIGKVRVFGGLPEYHQLEPQKQNTLIGTINVSFNSDNEGIVDVGGLLKDKINNNNDITSSNLPNDINEWNSVFIEFAESFDIVAAGQIQTFTSTFTTDEHTNCPVLSDILTNGDFSAGLADWTNVDIPPISIPLSVQNDWVATAVASCGDAARVIMPVGETSKFLVQSVVLNEGVEYRFRVTFDNVTSSQAFFTFAASTELDLSDFRFLGSFQLSLVSPQIFNFVSPRDFTQVHFACINLDIVSTTIDICEVELIPQDCKFYIFNSNSTRQFQNVIGGNMGDFVHNFNGQEVLAKWPTNFFESRYWRDRYFDISAIIPESTFVSSEDGDSVLIQLRLFDKTLDGTPFEPFGFMIPTFVIPNLNDGVYRLIGDIPLELRLINTPVNLVNPLGSTLDGLTFDEILTQAPIDFNAIFSGVVVTSVTKVEVSTVLLPQNILFDAHLGDMQPPEAGSPPPSWNVTLTIGGATAFSMLGVASSGAPLYGPFSGNGMAEMAFTFSGANAPFVEFDTPVTVKVGETYVLSMYVAYTGLAPVVSTFNERILRVRLVVDDTVNTSILATNEFSLFWDEPILGFFEPDPALAGQWKQITTTIKVLADTTIKFTIEFESTGFASSGSGTLLTLDEARLNGPIKVLSEAQTINIDDECADQEIYLTWKTSELSWDYWNFTAEAEHGFNIDNPIQMKRDIFQNWDSEFITGDTQQDWLSFDSIPTAQVFSQHMTKQELEAVLHIKNAIKVQQIRDDGTKVTVIVDKSSFTTFTDGDNLFSISFNIMYPQYQTIQQ